MKCRHLVPALLALLASGASVHGQNVFIYAFNESGRVSANGYELDNLPDSSSDDELWRDLFVQGPDRWLIRGDGRIELNGAQVTNLSGEDDWRGIVVDDQGTFYAMRRGGQVNDPSGELVDYPTNDHPFIDIAINGQVVFVLKENGSVYRVPEDGPLLKFNGSGEEGAGASKSWRRLLVHPVDGSLWGLRRDGLIQSAVVPVMPADPVDEGVEVASLPFDGGSNALVNELYTDLTIQPDGTWYALRANGELFSDAAQSEPITNFPGAPSEGSGQSYESLVAVEDEVLVLRADGEIYRNGFSDEIIDLKQSDYVGLAVGVAFPNLVNTENEPPIGTSMTVTAPEGADIAVPVLAVDPDLPAENLVLDVVPGTLPAGATWDGVTRTISWPGAGPVGTYKIEVTVDDGIDDPVTTKQTIKIKALDDADGKNDKPVIASMKKATALVAVPFSMRVLAYDVDGTAPDLSLDTSKPPPTNASFDTMTGILSWDSPLVGQVGTASLKFLATDGTATVKKTIKVKVMTSLLGF